jgi:hypothetical protein
MNLIEESFNLLYPEKEFNHEYSIKYSNKFKDFNANVRYTREKLNFHLSKKWRSVDKQIKMGLIQDLMTRVFKDKRKTTNIDMYNIFIKKLHLVVPKDKSHPVLEESFNRINERYFYGLIEKPNLVWGQHSRRKLGSYEYQTDTISISRILEKAEPALLDYIIYHETLHKKHKFHVKNGRNYHHTPEFKQKEKEFENADMRESELKRLITKTRVKKLFGLF